MSEEKFFDESFRIIVAVAALVIVIVAGLMIASPVRHVDDVNAFCSRMKDCSGGECVAGLRCVAGLLIECNNSLCVEMVNYSWRASK